MSEIEVTTLGGSGSSREEKAGVAVQGTAKGNSRLGESKGGEDQDGEQGERKHHKHAVSG